jgi:hypothetical protein
MNDFGLIDARNSPREAYNELYNRLSGEIVLL